MFITIQPEVYEDIFYQENILAAHKIVTNLTLVPGQEAPRSALRNNKEKKRKPGIQRTQRKAAGQAANEELRKKKEDLERERDVRFQHYIRLKVIEFKKSVCLDSRATYAIV